MLYPPGFYFVKKPKRFVILSSDKSSERSLSSFFDIKKPRRIEHLQSEEPFSSDPYFTFNAVVIVGVVSLLLFRLPNCVQVSSTKSKILCKLNEKCFVKLIWKWFWSHCVKTQSAAIAHRAAIRNFWVTFFHIIQCHGHWHVALRLNSFKWKIDTTKTDFEFKLS